MFVIANLLIFHVSILVNTANKQGFKGIGFRWSRLLLVGDYVGLYKLRDWNGVVGKYAVQVGLWVIEGLGDYYVTPSPSSLRILLKTFFFFWKCWNCIQITFRSFEYCFSTQLTTDDRLPMRRAPWQAWQKQKLLSPLAPACNMRSPPNLVFWQRRSLSFCIANFYGSNQ